MARLLQNSGNGAQLTYSFLPGNHEVRSSTTVQIPDCPLRFTLAHAVLSMCSHNGQNLQWCPQNPLCSAWQVCGVTVVETVDAAEVSTLGLLS